jgi:hypothetical protein
MRCSRDWSVLRAADPVGGDPEAVQQLARRCADTADAMHRGAVALRTVEGSATAWESTAGRAFRDRTGEVAAALERARPRYTSTAVALDHYAVRLRQVQDDADTVLVRAWQAHDESRSADHARWSATDPALKLLWGGRAEQAEAELRSAERALEAVEVSWHRAGQQAADALDEATSADGLDDSVRERIVDAGLDLVADLSKDAASVSAALGVVAVVLMVVPGGQPFAAGAGAASFAFGLAALAGSAVLVAGGRTTVRQLAAEVAWTVVAKATAGLGRFWAVRGSPAPAVRGPVPPRPATPRRLPTPVIAGEATGVAAPTTQPLIERATARDDHRARRSQQERERQRQAEREVARTAAAQLCPS